MKCPPALKLELQELVDDAATAIDWPEASRRGPWLFGLWHSPYREGDAPDGSGKQYYLRVGGRTGLWLGRSQGKKGCLYYVTVIGGHRCYCRWDMYTKRRVKRTIEALGRLKLRML